MSNRVQKHPAKFKCLVCPSSFTRKANLEDHLRSHTGEISSCDICGAVIRRGGDLARHKRLQHGGGPKYICGDLEEHDGRGCGRQFVRRDALGQHRRARDGKCTKQLWGKTSNATPHGGALETDDDDMEERVVRLLSFSSSLLHQIPC